MVMRAACTLLALLGSGCFDVHDVDPGPLLIDNFDDANAFPADPHFDQWRCGRFKPETRQDCECALDPNYHSPPYSIHLNTTIEDEANRTQDFGGATLYTHADVPEDFSQFAEIEFSAMLESGSPPIPGDARLYIELGCSGARTEDGSMPGNLYLDHQVEQRSYWQTYAVRLSDLVTPDWLGSKIEGGPAACLARIDTIHFSVVPGLADGQTGKFSLHVDDIDFR